MAIRNNAPMGFIHFALESFGLSRTTALLDKLNAATLWERLAQPIAKLLEYTNTKAGRHT